MSFVGIDGTFPAFMYAILFYLFCDNKCNILDEIGLDRELSMKIIFSVVIGFRIGYKNMLKFG